MSENEINQLNKQIETFKKNLEEFALKHKEEIRKNAQFRKQFQDMCANIGVDPLASSKGFWSEVLGVSDFYYELAVQIVEICNSMQEKTGGLVYLDKVLERINKVRNRFVKEVCIDDCKRSIKKLDIFGNAFTLIPVNNGRFMIQSVPEGMGVDHTQVIQLAEKSNGIITPKLMLEELKWDAYRVENVINFMLKEGIVWLDQQRSLGAIKVSYYFPSLFTSSTFSND